MTNTYLSILWAFFYLLCGALGFVTGAEGFFYGLLIFFSLLFFVPPSVLLYRAAKTGDVRWLKRIRNLSLAWLGTTLVLIVLNIATVGMSAAAGTFFYGVLILLTSPMVCSQFWVLPMFLWACLLIVSLQEIKKRK